MKYSIQVDVHYPDGASISYKNCRISGWAPNSNVLFFDEEDGTRHEVTVSAEVIHVPIKGEKP